MGLLDNTFTERAYGRERLTQKQKDANDKEWYKSKIDSFHKRSYDYKYTISTSSISRYRSQRVNYNLFNNIIDLRDFEHVCQPFGEGVGKLPANFANRDIVSSKIKVLLGMESDMPFSWKIAATNEDATTRREQEEFGQIKQFVTNTILQPIKEQIMQEEAEAASGRQLTPDEMNKLKEQLAQELQTRTPDEVRRYMVREHQDPAEVLITQLLQYLIQKEKIQFKFNKGWKHALLAAEEIYWIGIVNGEPVLRVVNPLRFDCDRSHDTDFIEDGEWAACEYRMTPTEIIKQFGSVLKPHEIDEIYEFYSNPTDLWDDATDFLPDYEHDPATIRVLHANWIGLRKIGFLRYFNQLTQSIEEKMVPDWYKLNLRAGDIDITWEWIPETHEGYKIGSDIYAYCRPVPGQHRDIDNLYNAKLSYYGTCIDNTNSVPTSPMDRMKSYQYYYNIIMYRIELLIASDKGKILMMNLQAIPKKLGIDIKKWMYFLEANKIGWYNPGEEGMRGSVDAGSMAKEIDMSLASSINEYIQLAEYIERRCGETVGVTKAMEGMTGPTEAVSNNRQNMIQASYILRPYFDIHNNVKANALQGLIEMAKVAYSGGKQRKLAYVLDDLSLQMLTVGGEAGGMLESSTYGLFVSNASSAYEAKQMIMQLAQAALQNQRADITDIIKVMRSESLQEGEEILEASQMRKDQQLQMQQEQALQAQSQQAEMERQSLERLEDKRHQNKLDEIRLKGEFDLQKQAMLSVGFNEDKDMDDDGQLDVIELYKLGQKARIDARKQALAEAQFAHQQRQDKKKSDQADEKLKIERAKSTKSNASH